MANKILAPKAVDDNDWECQDALRTIQRAKEIQSDPKMMAKVKAMAQSQAQSLQKIARQSVPTVKPKGRK